MSCGPSAPMPYLAVPKPVVPVIHRRPVCAVLRMTSQIPRYSPARTGSFTSDRYQVPSAQSVSRKVTPCSICSATSARPRRTLLVIDDDGVQRTVLGKVGSKAGYAVTTVATVEEAIKEIERQHFDCIVLDLMLNGQNGMLMLGEIAKFNRDALLIIISGASEAVREQTLRAGHTSKSRCRRPAQAGRSRRPAHLAHDRFESCAADMRLNHDQSSRIAGAQPGPKLRYCVEGASRAAGRIRRRSRPRGLRDHLVGGTRFGNPMRNFQRLRCACRRPVGMHAGPGASRRNHRRHERRRSASCPQQVRLSGHHPADQQSRRFDGGADPPAGSAALASSPAALDQADREGGAEERTSRA